jgi:hypothetical protein
VDEEEKVVMIVSPDTPPYKKGYENCDGKMLRSKETNDESAINGSMATGYTQSCYLPK